MDIWASRCKGEWFVLFLSDAAQDWAKRSEYYHDIPPDAGIWMSPGEYDELRDNIPQEFIIIHGDNKEH